jgi:hypothetical protein
VYLVLLLAALAILGGVVVVAMGRGGELTLFHKDVPVLYTQLRTPADVATVRLPLVPFGYQVQATGDALVAAANLLADREAEIVALRRELWRLGWTDDFSASGSVGFGHAVAVGPASPGDSVRSAADDAAGTDDDAGDAEGHSTPEGEWQGAGLAGRDQPRQS